MLDAEIHIGVFMCRVKVLGWDNSPNKGPRGEGLGELNATICECSHMWLQPILYK
jgi:hypothetical protein